MQHAPSRPTLPRFFPCSMASTQYLRSSGYQMMKCHVNCRAHAFAAQQVTNRTLKPRAHACQGTERRHALNKLRPLHHAALASNNIWVLRMPQTGFCRRHTRWRSSALRSQPPAALPLATLLSSLSAAVGNATTLTNASRRNRSRLTRACNYRLLTPFAAAHSSLPAPHRPTYASLGRCTTSSTHLHSYTETGEHGTTQPDHSPCTHRQARRTERKTRNVRKEANAAGITAHVSSPP